MAPEDTAGALGRTLRAAFADPDIRNAWVRDRGMRVFSFVDPDNPMRLVDVFASHPKGAVA